LQEDSGVWDGDSVFVDDGNGGDKAGLRRGSAGKGERERKEDSTHAVSAILLFECATVGVALKWQNSVRTRQYPKLVRLCPRLLGEDEYFKTPNNAVK
jgi:hypothetical protein